MTTLASRPIPLVDLQVIHAPVMNDLRAAFERVLTGGTFSGGAEIAAFEDQLAHHLGVRHVVAVASGTAALHLALLAAGIGRGDEVVLPPNTFFATAEAVVAVGATPVFADVDPNTALVNPAAIEAMVSPRTAAIIAVDLYGQPVDPEPLRRIAA